jgi:hypothetical protein
MKEKMEQLNQLKGELSKEWNKKKAARDYEKIKTIQQQINDVKAGLR